ncbi:MAG TPA: DUF445 family protein [Oligoflexia bacterium]|nr:DUF445 family protein [Oligoflexia bacterium]HMP47905.1 DUF445 family protein [Oligoflexia bacterium]
MELNILLPNLAFLAIPLISGSIGWFTNYIAIKMLFHPRNPINIIGIRIHGVFPKRQSELASKLGELFAEKLGVQSRISEELKKTVDENNVTSELNERINALARDFIKTEVPFLAAFASDELISTLSKKVSDDLGFKLKEKFESGAKDFANKLNIKKVVQTQIDALEPENLEKMLKDLLKREFRFIELSGALLGFLIGCIQIIFGYYLFKSSNF